MNKSKNDEEWKWVSGYEGYYQVSNLGNVKSVDRNILYSNGIKRKHKGKLLSPEIDKDGYERVDFRRNGSHDKQFVHRVVAKEFIPNLENYPVINHKNEIQDDNRVDNLEWCTIKYNHGYGNARMKNAKSVSKPVVGKCIDTGNEISFESLTQAGENGYTAKSVSKAAKGGGKPYRGYTWNFKLNKHKEDNNV